MHKRHISWLVSSHTPSSGDLPCSPGVCPDGTQPATFKVTGLSCARSEAPHQPGLNGRVSAGRVRVGKGRPTSGPVATGELQE